MEIELTWTEVPPTEPGTYWFYGDPYYGSMGLHYMEPFPAPDCEMALVEVMKIQNGVLAKSNGQMFNLRRFNRAKQRGEGHIGYFAKATLPEPPQDILNLFS